MSHIISHEKSHKGTVQLEKGWIREEEEAARRETVHTHHSHYLTLDTTNKTKTQTLWLEKK